MRRINFRKLDFGRIFDVVRAIAPMVRQVQQDMKAPGADKHEAVADGAMVVLMAIEGLADKDLVDNGVLRTALDQVIVAEKAALKAREALSALIADIKSKR